MVRVEHLRMTDGNQTSGPGSSSRRSTRLRLIGLIVLGLGIGGAGIVYWAGSPDRSDDPARLGFNRPKERQMGLLYGKMGTLIQNWSDDLEQPGTQAAFIAGFAVLVAGGCYYFARLLDHDDQTD